MLASTAATSLGLAVSAAGLTLGNLFTGHSIDNIATDAALFGAMTIATSIAYRRTCMRLAKVNRPADAAFHEGYDMGYDKGWLEGHKEARPVLVQLGARRGPPSVKAEIANS